MLETRRDKRPDVYKSKPNPFADQNPSNNQCLPGCAQQTELSLPGFQRSPRISSPGAVTSLGLKPPARPISQARWNQLRRWLESPGPSRGPSPGPDARTEAGASFYNSTTV